MSRGIFLAAVATALLTLSLDGCFTEIGNAEGENKIRADFKIDYTRVPALPKLSSGWMGGPAGKAGTALITHDTIIVEHFYLLVREAEYHLKGGGERHLWRESGAGVPVDFTGKDKIAMLPVRPIEPDSILDFSLECRIQAPPVKEPDSLDFGTFVDKGYIKGTYTADGVSIPFLFALPQADNLHIRYSPAVLESWRTGSEYDMQVVFFALKWISHSGIEEARRSKDRLGKSMVMIDTLHNPALHRILSDRFFTGFNTATVEKG